MPVLAGKSASLGLGASNIALSSFTIELKTDLNDSSSWASGFKTNVAGMQSATFSARGPYSVASTAVTTGSSYALNCRLNSTVGILANVRISSVRVVVDINAATMLEISGEGDGTVDIAVT